MADDFTLKPTLEYRWLRRDGDGLVGDGFALATVNQITFHWDGDAYATGKMRCKDGHRGPSRSLKLDLERHQPDWLVAIIIDARKRGF